MQEDYDLNTETFILDEDLAPFVPFERVGATRHDVAQVEVVFDDIEERLLGLIHEAEVVTGVVAWLTSEPLLNALTRKKYVSIVVQKEDFLRPDREGVVPEAWKTRLQTLYSQVPEFLERHLGAVPAPLAAMSCCSDPTIDGIRCAGTRTAGIEARVHHKFVVFARVEEGFDNQPYPPWQRCLANATRLVPYAVATGSYNWTANAKKSRENIVVIHDPHLASEYMTEWANICAISEPLNWEHEYIDPEWRVGT